MKIVCKIENIRIEEATPQGETFYRIHEIATPQGYYITWEGIYATLKGAVAEVEKVLGTKVIPVVP